MRKVRIVSDAYYHLYNRGVNRGPIFFEEQNWGFFVNLLRKYFLPSHAEIIAYCLMPNRYHLLVYSRSERIGLEIMQPFAVSYTKAINKQQNRVGPLFQGPYQVKHVENEDHLSWLTRYIHLNPVEGGLVTEPAEWFFSSYRDYIGVRQGTLPVPEVVLAHFESHSEYKAFVEQKEIPDPEEARTLLVG